MGLGWPCEPAMLTFTALLRNLIKSGVLYFSHDKIRMRDENAGYAALFKGRHASLMIHVSQHARY